MTDIVVTMIVSTLTMACVIASRLARDVQIVRLLRNLASGEDGLNQEQRFEVCRRLTAALGPTRYQAPDMEAIVDDSSSARRTLPMSCP